MAGRVYEYRNWAGQLRTGRTIAGEKLEPESRRLGSVGSDAGSSALGGYFVIVGEGLRGRPRGRELVPAPEARGDRGPPDRAHVSPATGRHEDAPAQKGSGIANWT